MESDSRGLCGTVEDARLFLNVYKKDMSGAELYLDPSEILRAGCLKGVELLFRCLKKSGNSLSTGPLEELYTREFDEDQVWEQMQLTNEPALLSLHSTVQKLECGLRLLVSQPEEKCGGTGSMGQEDGVAEVQWSHSDEGEEEEEEEEGRGEEEEEEEEQDEEGAEEDRAVLEDDDVQRSKVDDDFFSLSAMEQYLEKAEQLSDHGSEGSVGALADEISNNDSHQPHYHDFFDPPACQAEQLSTYEKRQQKLARQITSIELANVQSKSWQMSGEVSSQSRPINSLLEEDVDFDPMTLPAPVVTEESTHTIEDIIRKRIIDQVWDDVQRKVKPPEKPYDYQKARPLNQEKSQRSLAEVYEEDYREAVVTDQQTEKQDDPRHLEVEELRKRLFLKLDALSNFHFTPKPPHSEAGVVSNVSAVAMEEVTPSATAQHTLLAPEEVQARSREPEKGASEKTNADRRRLRVAKKRLKRRRGLTSLLPGSGSSKIKGLKRREKSSSRHFFASLQEQAKDHITSQLHEDD